jgi:hypothetical protein
MTTTQGTIAKIQERTFEQALTEGVSEAGTLILRLSARAVREVRKSPVAELAAKLDKTLQVFIHDPSDKSMRFSAMATPMVQKVLARRGTTFSSLEKGHRLIKIGKSFGYMIGMSVLTSVIGVFASSGGENIQARQDLSDEAKRLCIDYIHDALGYILMNMSATLDHDFRVSPKDRELFSQILLELGEEQGAQTVHSEGSPAAVDEGE